MNRKNPDESNLFEDARDEIVGIAKGGAKHPGTAPVLTGAAIGTLAGAILPVVTWPIGLIAGVGIAVYRRIRK